MTARLVLLLLACSLTLAIGCCVLLHDRRRLQNQLFGLLTAFAAAWIFAIAAALHFSQQPLAWVRVSFAAGCLLPVVILMICQAFPRAERVTLNSFSGLLIATGLALFALSFSNYMVAYATVQEGHLRLTYGPLHRWLAVYVVSSIGYGALVLFRTYKAADVQTKSQAWYLAMGLLLPAALAITSNLVFPLLGGTSRFSGYGPLSSLLMVLLIAHAIIRHRLMDVRMVVKRGAVYLAAFVAAGAILLTLLIASRSIFPGADGFAPRDILLALTVAVLFHPLKAQVRRGFDRYLYREPWDYQRTLREASRDLGGTIHLPALLARVVDVLAKTLRPEAAAVYLLDPEEGQFVCAFASGEHRFPETVPGRSAGVEAMAHGRKIVFRDELTPVRGASAVEDVLTHLEQLGAEVLVPLLEAGRLVGFLAVTAKRSGDPFFSDDEDLLVTLANQSAVAVRNAQVHQQVVQVSEHLQKILGAIESGVVAINTKGRVTLFNRAAELMTRIPAADITGRSPEHLPAALARLIQVTIRDGEPQSQVELALPDAAGQLVPLVCSTSVLRHPDGGVVGAVAVLSDLSRVKELEAERRRAERLASIEAMASGLVHEIRNPMVAIKTFLHYLPVRYDDGQFRENFARSGGRAVERIEELLRQVRTLSSASSQRMDLIDVREPLRAALDLLQAQFEAHRVRVRQVADGTPRLVRGNASQLEQLFHNLCLNAIEAMDEEGELTVRVADLCADGAATLLVELSDTGCGIPEDRLEAIFAPFASSKPHGTGLGLAICRGIADAHRATIHARNNIGRPGATLTVAFPVVAERQARIGA